MSKAQRKRRIIIIISFILLFIVATIIYNVITGNTDGAVSDINASEFTLHIIDVGQGDAAFIDNGDHDILIDSGPDSESEELIAYLDSLGVEKIEYVFFSHPHEDHIGGADDILLKYDVSKVIMPNSSEDTKCYEYMMDAIEESGIEPIYVSAGDSFKIGEADVKIFSPAADSDYNDQNLMSLIMKLSYGEMDFLFTGDAESKNESYVIDNYYDELDCEVIKVAHHGSSTSSDPSFIEAVSPVIALISVGEDNLYGHPYAGTLATLENYAEEIYRTDRNGDIVIGCNGDRVWYVED